jgi:outer membrane protein assembly factor BamC
MNLLRLVISISLSVLVASCSSDGEERPEYLDSHTVKGLEVPPTLTRPNNHDELKIPQPTAKAMALLKEREQAQGSVAPIFKGVELQSEQGLYWLLIDEDADVLWMQLKDFWANEGIEIDRDEPLLGFMETKWIKDYKETRGAGFYSKMLSSLSPDEMDKFRMRVERLKDKKQTRLYVSHRGQEIVVTEDTSRWSRKAADKTLEKEILSRFVLFSGLSKEKTADVFADYKPFQSRIHAIEGTSDYKITGRTDFVWRRLMHALDRLGVEIKNKNKVDGKAEVLVSKIDDQFVEQEEDKHSYTDPEDETSANKKQSESDSASDAGQKQQAESVKVLLKLNAMNKATRLQLTLADGEEISSGVSLKFRDGLVNLLK